MGDETHLDKDISLVPDQENFACGGSQVGPIFVPPLYLQRYVYVQQELQKHQVKSVRITTICSIKKTQN